MIYLSSSHHLCVYLPTSLFPLDPRSQILSEWITHSNSFFGIFCVAKSYKEPSSSSYGRSEEHSSTICREIWDITGNKCSNYCFYFLLFFYLLLVFFCLFVVFFVLHFFVFFIFFFSLLFHFINPIWSALSHIIFSWHKIVFCCLNLFLLPILFFSYILFSSILFSLPL